MCNDTVPILYRKRIIPNECIKLKDDIILHSDPSKIITSWKAFREKPDLSYGYSCYYLDRGFKLSKFYRADHTFSLWYFDIVSYEKGPEDNSLLILDLLADVLVHPDGSLKVVDLDELADAVKQNLLTEAQLQQCLRNLNTLLTEIYSHSVSRLIVPLEEEIAKERSLIYQKD